MGLLDSVVGAVAGQVLGGGNGGQSQIAMKLISALMQQGGGVSGVFSKLTAGGLGGALASWICNGANQSVSGDAIANALGSQLLGGVAKSANVDSGLASNLLAQYLPNMINNITPNGTQQEAEGFDLSDGLDMGDLAALASKFLK